MRRASAMSIGAPGSLRPRQLDQPVEIGADHRVLAGAVGHALEALRAPCAPASRPRRASSPRRSPSRAPRLRARSSSPSPSSFWIVRICSRSRCLRLASLIDSRVRSSISCARPSAPRCGARAGRAACRAAREGRRSRAAPASPRRLMSIRPAMKSASCAGALDRLERGDHLLGHLRQQLAAPPARGCAAPARGPRPRASRRRPPRSAGCARPGTDSRRGTAARGSAAGPCRWRGARRPAR